MSESGGRASPSPRRRSWLTATKTVPDLREFGTVTLVVDSSTVVAALVDAGPTGGWAERALASDDLAAPHLMPVEAADVLRRAAAAGEITADAASLAHGDLLSLRVELFPYEPFASRVWELKGSVTAYDGWYVALAEALAADLATLDGRRGRADGPRCGFRIPPE